MNLKKLSIVMLSLFFLQRLFAFSNPYDSADKKTKQVLEKCDKLIEERKYESAFKSFSGVEENEYIIAKKIEICIDYFSQSIMHQMFCLSDLKEGQTLYDERTGDGSFSMIMGDPVQMVEEFVSSYGNKPILNYVLGLYYSSVLNCYGDQWLISVEEIIQKMNSYYQKALDQNCYSGFSLSELALSYLRLGDYKKSTDIYELKKTVKEEFSVEDNYNYGYAYFLAANYEKALPLLLQSVKDYADNPNYLFDTYFILSKAYINLSKYEEADICLQNCISINKNDYRIYELQIILYGIQKQKNKTIEASQKLFSMAPTNPSAPQMVMRNYFNYGIGEWLIDFFVETEALYQNDLTAMQNLTFHHAFSLDYLGKSKEAKEIAQIAKEYFQKNNELTDEILEQLESIGKN